MAVAVVGNRLPAAFEGTQGLLGNGASRLLEDDVLAAELVFSGMQRCFYDYLALVVFLSDVALSFSAITSVFNALLPGGTAADICKTKQSLSAEMTNDNIDSLVPGKEITEALRLKRETAAGEAQYDDDDDDSNDGGNEGEEAGGEEESGDGEEGGVEDGGDEDNDEEEDAAEEQGEEEDAGDDDDDDDGDEPYEEEEDDEDEEDDNEEEEEPPKKRKK